MKTTVAYLLIGSAAALPVAKPLLDLGINGPLTTTVNIGDLTHLQNLQDLTKFAGLTNLESLQGLKTLPVVGNLLPTVQKREADALLGNLPVVTDLGLNKLPIVPGLDVSKLPVVPDLGLNKLPVVGGLPVVKDVLNTGTPGQVNQNSGQLLGNLPVVSGLGLGKLPLVGGLLKRHQQEREATTVTVNVKDLELTKLSADEIRGLGRVPIVQGVHSLPIVNSLPFVTDILGGK